MRTTYGFFLWELAIGMVLLLLASSLISHWHRRQMIEHAHLQDRLKALFLALSLLEKFKAGSYPPKMKGIYAIAVHEVRDHALPTFYQVKLTLTWNDQELTLTSGFAK